MKKKSASQSVPARRSLGEGRSFKLRVLLAFVFCVAGALIALAGPSDGLSFRHTNEYYQYSAPPEVAHARRQIPIRKPVNSRKHLRPGFCSDRRERDYWRLHG